MDYEPKRDEACGANARGQLLEVGAFILLLLPSLLLPYFTGKQLGGSFILTAVGAMLHDAAFVGLIAYFVWRNGERPECLGWAENRVGKEIMLGFWLFLFMTLSSNLIEHAFTAAGVSVPSHPLPSSLIPGSPVEYVVALVLVTAVAISEETIFRGYLILRLTAVFRSRAAAVLISTLIFSLGHSYEGVLGVIAVFLIGLFLAVVYMWRKSLVAPMVIHFLQDFVGLFGAALSKGMQG